MDVRLKKRVFRLAAFCLLFLQAGCGGNHYDPKSAAGFNAIIDDTNNHLSRAECQLAYNSITKVYGTQYENDQVRILMASTWACFAGFNFFTMSSNLASGSGSYFARMTMSMPSTSGDGHINYLYHAIDTLTRNGANMAASSRASEVNNYMVFVQFALIGAILYTYGNVNSSYVGSISYNLPPVGADLSNTDACALAAAFSILSDSYSYSTLNDSTTSSAYNTLNAACVSAGLVSCSSINQDRTVCTGSALDANSVTAQSIVGAVDASW